MLRLANPYATQDLYVASEFRDRMEELVARSDKDGSRPFSRQVDAWWFAMCVGVIKGIRTRLPEKQVKFNDGAIFATDPWRITQLELLTISELGVEALDSPRATIALASEYAQTGFVWVLDTVLGAGEPNLALLNSLDSLIA